MVHIIGSGTETQHEQTGHDESRRVYVTNFLSFGHLIPWGGLIDVKRLTPEEVRAMFVEKRIDLFAYPDLELMRDLVQNAAALTGQIPEGDQAQHEAAFCHMVNALVQQAAGCHIRSVPKPKPTTQGRKHIYLQIYLPPTSIAGGATLGSIWWEITPKEIRQKPGATL